MKRVKKKEESRRPYYKKVRRRLLLFHIAKAGKRVPLLFPFLPIPYLFQRLLRRLPPSYLTRDRLESREEKSLRHVAMVAKRLDDNKPKTWVHTVSNFIDLIQFHFKFVKCWRNFLGLNSKVLKKKKKIFVLCSPTLSSGSMKLGSFM